MIGVWSGWLRRLRRRPAPDNPASTSAPETGLHDVAASEAAEAGATVSPAQTPDQADGDKLNADASAVPARTTLEWLAAGQPAAARAGLAAEPDDPELSNLIDAIADGEDILRAHASAAVAADTEPLAGVMLAPSEGGRTLAVVFGADDGGFAVPRALAQDGRLNLLFVRDPQACLAMLGVARLGASYDDCLLAITRLARELGVRDIVCIGGGAAAYSALRYGLDLGASGVLALGTLTRLERGRYVPGLRPGRRTTALLRLAAELGADLDEVFAQAARRPGLVLCRSANSPSQGLATLPGVTVVEAPRSAARDLLGWADTAGRLPEMLAQVLRCRPVG